MGFCQAKVLPRIPLKFLNNASSIFYQKMHQVMEGNETENIWRYELSSSSSSYSSSSSSSSPKRRKTISPEVKSGTRLFAPTTNVTGLINFDISALLCVFVSSGVTFAVLRFRCGAEVVGKNLKPLLLSRFYQ